MAGLGDSFKSAREAKGLTLDQIAQETRISARFLRAIEGEEFGELPGGLFNRGFIRTYAAKVGMDPDSAVRDYQALTQPGPEPPPEGEPTGPEKSGKRRAVPIAAGGLIALIVLVWAIQHGGVSPADRVAESEEGPIAQVAEIRSPQRASRLTALQGPEDRGSIPSASVAAPEEPAGAAVDDREAVGQPEPPTTAPTVSRAAVEAPSIPVLSEAEAEPESETAGSGVSVEVQAHEETWVLVEADGRMVTDQWGVTLPAGTTRHYTANDALELRIGNAAGVTLNVNGREIRNLGRANQVRTFTITPDNAGSLTGS